MNERFEKLVAEAFFDETADASDTKIYKLNDAQMQKFAELIVQECSAFANHFSDGYEKDRFGRKLFLYRADIGQVVLEHFGVEE